jgi:hypothetical protein
MIQLSKAAQLSEKAGPLQHKSKNTFFTRLKLPHRDLVTVEAKRKDCE